MSNLDKRQYTKAHIWGKLIAWALSTFILNILLWEYPWYEHILWSLFNALYWFGTNTFAYLYEELHHWKHRHNKL